MSENKDFYSLTGIQGCDFVIKINGEVLGSISNFKFDTSNKMINMSSIVFGTKQSEIKVYQDEEMLENLNNATVEQYFANEHGFKAYRKFTGVKFLNQKGDLDVDTYDPVRKKVDYYNEVYAFRYSSVTPLYLIPDNISFEDIPEAIKEYKKNLEIKKGKEAIEREKQAIEDRIEYLQSELKGIDGLKSGIKEK